MDYIRQEWTPTRITGSGTVVVASGRSLLHSIHFNAPSGLISIYNALSVTGTPIAVLGSGTLVSGEVLDWVFPTGITITSGAANTDITITAANN